MEKGSTHMHVGGAMVFGGPALEADALMDTIDWRLDLVPRYCQKVLTPPLGTGRPYQGMPWGYCTLGLIVLF